MLWQEVTEASEGIRKICYLGWEWKEKVQMGKNHKNRGVKHRSRKLLRSVSYEEGVRDKVQEMGRRQTLYGFISQNKSLIVGVMEAMKDLGGRMIWYDLLKKEKKDYLAV